MSINININFILALFILVSTKWYSKSMDFKEAQKRKKEHPEEIDITIPAISFIIYSLVIESGKGWREVTLHTLLGCFVFLFIFYIVSEILS